MPTNGGPRLNQRQQPLPVGRVPLQQHLLSFGLGT